MNTTRLTHLIMPLSLLISAWLSWQTMTHRLIDLDGTLYLDAAQAYLDHGFSAALTVYRWPFFPISFATLHQITGFSLIASAQIFNTAALMLLSQQFLSIIQLINPERDDSSAFRITLFGALIILFLPEISRLRSDLIRDISYWALLFSGLNAGCRFILSGKWRWVASSVLLQLLASLFRVEAIVWAVLSLPSLLGRRWRLQAWGTLVIFSAAAFFWGLFLIKQGISPTNRLMELCIDIANFWQRIDINLHDKALIVEHQILNPLAQTLHVGPIFLLGGLTSLFFAELTRAFGWLFVVIWIWDWKNTRRNPAEPKAACHLFLMGALFCLLTIDAFVVVTDYIFVCRWILPAVLILHLRTPQVLERIYQTLSPMKKRIFWGILISLSVASLWNVCFPFGPSKLYIRDASTWVNRQIATDDQIWTNDRQMGYYLNFPSPQRLFDDTLFPNWNDPQGIVCQQKHCQPATITQFLKSKSPKRWLVMKVPRQISQPSTTLFAQLPPPIQTFRNHHGDRVMIWRWPV